MAKMIPLRPFAVTLAFVQALMAITIVWESAEAVVARRSGDLIGTLLHGLPAAVAMYGLALLFGAALFAAWIISLVVCTVASDAPPLKVAHVAAPASPIATDPWSTDDVAPLASAHDHPSDAPVVKSLTYRHVANGSN